MEIIDGRYFGAGKKNLFLKILGDGYPTVVIESGLGGLSAEWSFVQKEIAKFTTCISYDRMGYGESPTGDTPRNAKKIASELFNALTNSNEREPFLFVAHDSGAIYALQYLSMFPHETVGIVFVDPITPYESLDGYENTPLYNQKASTRTRIELMKPMLEKTNEEIEKIFVPILENLYSKFPTELKEPLIAYQSDKKLIKAVIDEFESLPESMEELRNSNELPIAPAKILLRDYKQSISLSMGIGIDEDEARYIEEKWIVNSKLLADHFSNCGLSIIKDANHYIHLTKPEAIVAEVFEFVSQFREKLQNSK